MAAIISRKFAEESIQFLGKKVSIETSDNKNYSGVLVGLSEKFDLILNDVDSQQIQKMMINGLFVKEIKLLERPFDLKALADRLSRIFPGLVKIRDDVGAIIVMDKIKVTESGVEEGSGLAASRVKAIYDEFLKESKS
ncbi:MAG: Lsm family RNA-binding protein [Candidatus Nitrosocosmicus sp.]|jgi:small nuclear ribonucleoprotein (snRNP)-like protein|nr:Lsm family RNA-binding protein [Candidatus Nitrosocosmicus sp.]